jgi:hypothetical protein
MNLKEIHLSTPALAYNAGAAVEGLCLLKPDTYEKLATGTEDEARAAFIDVVGAADMLLDWGSALAQAAEKIRNRRPSVALGEGVYYSTLLDEFLLRLLPVLNKIAFG